MTQRTRIASSRCNASHLILTSRSGTHPGAPNLPAVLHMTNTDARVDALDQALSRVSSADRLGGSTATIRTLVITSASLLMCACGGGGGGNDAPVATPPPAATELAWDNGNWDQQEWK